MSGEITPIHLLPDSERVLRAHGAWHAQWDAQEAEPDLQVLIRFAYDCYSRAMSPAEVTWQMEEKFPSLPASQLRKARRGAERALRAAETVPPELQRAIVAAARQRAIQGALATGDWGMALKGLERAGEIAGELRESAGLGEEDLILRVSVEDETGLALPEAQSQPVSGEIEDGLMPETVEAEAGSN